MEQIKAYDLAPVLGVTPPRIYQLVKLGVIKQDPVTGLFNLEAAKQAYLDYKLSKLRAQGLL